MRILIRYGIGYGTHDEEIEVDEDTCDDEIDRQVLECLTGRLDYGWHKEGQ